ncbi:hypothetical protein M2102_000213 [Fusobacterium sp. PH5-7]|uniref:autotransporter outer membrane beta-barrel domain-containing protein n=1 Tax=Fusobacterium sp. PH5-7 TaxID=2940528 RepID=UPI002475AF0C|nr:autotransporter outer membrane beta-barrel domain-containing protein [Fusobacterium sp. PH5-7]MDH6456600.1 hypothetical protein [Fusobacterium sp. PH5-7]
MIEKIMKAVKSGNKKRGRNITVGAVVGMLLSCTVVMGAGTDVTGLEIINNGSKIEFIDKDGKKFEPGAENDPYPENTWNEETKLYINNSKISGESTDGNGCGLKINEDGVNIVSNGMIIITTEKVGGTIYGLDVYGNGVNIENNGKIIAIYKATAISSIGIGVDEDMNNITNSGLINAIVDESGDSYGIMTFASVNDITNRGVINSRGASNASYGISIGAATKSIENSGVIYGDKHAIYNSYSIDNTYNYGLLVSSTDETVSSVTLTKNLGLIFKDDSGTYKAEDDDFKIFGTTTTDAEVTVGYDEKDSPIKEKYTIINAKAKNDDKNNIGGTESLTLKKGTLSYLDSDGSEQNESIFSDKKYILNGIEDTLKISGRKNELNNSVVNAYKTAVVMDQEMSMLTLDNTVVNGGVADGSTTISITENGSTLTIKGDSVINTRDKGVAITVDGNDNAVTLEGNAIVNGKMESNGNNILNLYGKADGSMNMFYDISGFTDISIDNNVTFFEDMKVTGTDNVTVEKSGVLSLRLKKDGDLSPAAIASSTSISTATHAFSGTDGMTIEGISPEETGTLNFITNGIGKKVLVNMKNIELNNIKVKTNSIIDKVDLDTYKDEGYIYLGAGSDLDGIVNPKVNKYNSLNKIYKSIYNSTDEKNLDGLRDILGMTFLGKNYDYNSSSEDQLKILLSYLNDIYIGTPYSYSSELSRRSVGMFRDIITENEFKPNLNKWMIMGGLTHADGGTKDTYYGQNYHGIDVGTSDTDADMKLTGAYMLAKYGYSENTSLGLTLGGNKSEAELDMAKVKGNSGYLGAFAENYRGNLTLKAGAGVQYSEYDADRRTLGNAYSDKYSDMTYDIYLNGRYSHQVGNNLFLEPYATLSYTYVDQDGANEGSKVLAIETDSKSFDYTVGKVGVDLKKVIPHEKGKSTLSAGVSYTKILDGADEEYITGRFKGSTTDFDILVAHKNEHSIGLNAKYALELESGIIFDVKGTYSVERDSHNGSAKNKTKGEWIVGAGVGYKF